MSLRLRNDKGEAGAVAVIVAIMALLIFSVGALAIDIGNGYARKRASQTTADLAALAGAAQLGKAGGVAAARRAAIDYITSKNVTKDDDDAAFPTCVVTTATNACWDNDGDENNGEISFTDDAGTATTGIGATRIRVITPRRKVSFGLGTVMGFDSVTVQKAATAGIFSPGNGATPPFYLTGSDMGMTCIKDDSPGGGSPIAMRSVFVPTVGASTTITSANPASNTQLELTAFHLNLSGTNMDNTDRVRFHNQATNTDYDITGTAANIVAKSNGKDVDLDVPATIPAGTYTITVAQGATFSGGSLANYVLKAKPAATPPTVTNINPANGNELATGTFTITGTNLKGAGATTVSFGGGGNATGVTPNAAGTSLTGTFPAMPAGTYPVTVTNSLGTSTQNVTYTATALPKPTGVVLIPNSGPNTGGQTVTITGTNLPASTAVATVTFNGANATVVSSSATSMTVTTPPGTVGIAQVVVTNGTTQSDPVAYTYYTDPTVCAGTSSNRGFIDEPRKDTNAQSVIDNIKLGIDHNLHTWQTYLLPAGAPARDASTYIANHTECDGMPAGTIYKSGSSTPAPDVNCLRLRTGSITGFEKGFFDNPDGRLYKKDAGADTGTIGGHANVDIDDLFDPRFIDPANVTAFRTAIQAGLKPTALQKDWIKDEIFKCPRFALLPVTNAPDDPPNGTSYFPIVGFKAMFITSVAADTSSDHGFRFQGGSLRTVKGWVFDLDWLPGNVSSEAVLGTQAYVGVGPVVSKLIRDKDDGTY